LYRLLKYWSTQVLLLEPTVDTGFSVLLDY
jgi:hypothetical protein